MVATSKTVDLARTDIDCAIRFGEGQWTDVTATPMGCRAFRPVASPALAARLRRPVDLAGVPVIEDTATMLSWVKWFDAASAAMPELSGPPTPTRRWRSTRRSPDRACCWRWTK
jgi:DNA-binding transcriptional LysR family regulator